MLKGDSEGGMTEIRFIPDDKSRLDLLFQVGFLSIYIYNALVSLFHQWGGGASNIFKQFFSFSITGLDSLRISAFLTLARIKIEKIIEIDSPYFLGNE